MAPGRVEGWHFGEYAGVIHGRMAGMTRCRNYRESSTIKGGKRCMTGTIMARSMQRIMLSQLS